jgi:UDP-N-acetylglucosamine diphosphorylase/glucosamine-1-phosphate N-acetyltransferase
MRVCLFEDHGVADLEPLSLTRPVFDLLCGPTTLGGKQGRFFGLAPSGVLLRPALAPLYRLHNPEVAVNDHAWFSSGPTILVNGRWLPPVPTGPFTDSSPCIGLVDEEVAFAVVDAGRLGACASLPLEECLARWKAELACRPAGGRLVRWLWQLVQWNGSQIIEEWESQSGDSSGYRQSKRAAVPGQQEHLPHVVGPVERLSIDPTARLDPLVVMDTTNGPVAIGREAVISAFSRLEGPCVVGWRSQVLGARIRAGTTLGPNCRVGGEIEASILQGNANKYHDGFLGHAYVGEWVNLGAGTQNSDLRNDYGPVTVMVNGRPVSSGLTKVGCFLGDHTKSGLGSLLNTGTNVGIFANLLPGGLLPKYVPSFASWWNQKLVDRSDLNALLRTAAEVLGRRNVVFTEAHAVLYRTLYEQTAEERRRALRDADLRDLRRSA